jgi:ornithine decarboxylase
MTDFLTPTHQFIQNESPTTPCLIVDNAVVEENYNQFANHFGFADCYYAIKSNPHPCILDMLVSRGSCFDCATFNEIKMVASAMIRVLGYIKPDRISFGNTIKDEEQIKKAYKMGVRLFAVDCIPEVDKIARVANGSGVFCRILTSGKGADWPLSKKFGCDSEMAVDVLTYASNLGLIARGVSLHVGSQQNCRTAWDEPIGDARHIFDLLAQVGINCDLLNLGGGFPTQYTGDKIQSVSRYAEAISEAISTFFHNIDLTIIIEPGRAMVGNAGVILTKVRLVAEKSKKDPIKWVYLDVGRYGGLPETENEAIRYVIKKLVEQDEEYATFAVAGPTCDSADVLYKNYSLPCSIAIGDLLIIHGTGAYTYTYSSVNFNGIEPLSIHVI